MNDPKVPTGLAGPEEPGEPGKPGEPEGPKGPAAPGEAGAPEAAPGCPRCGASRRPDNTPSCGCTHRASEALRDARGAQAAAAEDFDPLRVRPYVTLEGSTGPGSPEGFEGSGGPEASEDATGSEDPEGSKGSQASEEGARGPQRPEGSGAREGIEAPEGLQAPEGPEAPEVPQDPNLPVVRTPLSASAPAPRTADLELFGAPRTAAERDGDGHGERRRHARPRRTALLVGAGVLVAVGTVAAFAGGLVSYEAPARDGAAPAGVRASVPDGTGGRPPAQAPSGTPAGQSVTPSAGRESRSPSPDASASPSASPSRTSASPTRSPSAARTSEAATSSPPGTPAQTEPAEADAVLDRGSQGPAVADLQSRLKEVHVYAGDIDGDYDRGVEQAVAMYQVWRGIRGDESGVYGPETRERLEAETDDR